MKNQGQSEAARMAVEHIELARRLARRRIKRPDYLPDATQAALLGLVEACARFRPEDGDFVSFASMRIHGAITDWQRANHVIPMRKSHDGPAFFLSVDEILEEGDDGESKSAQALAIERSGRLVDPITPEDQVATVNLLRSFPRRVQHFVLGRMIGMSRREMAESAQLSETRMSQISAEAKQALEAVAA